MNSGCPCLFVKPCKYSCSCANLGMSGGCDRCATYGSREQQFAAAEYIAAILDAAPSAPEAVVPEGFVLVPREFLSSARSAVNMRLNQQSQAVLKCERGDLPAHYLAALKQDEERAIKFLDDIDAVLAAASPAKQPMEPESEEMRRILEKQLRERGNKPAKQLKWE